jgi:hypothetical protein
MHVRSFRGRISLECRSFRGGAPTFFAPQSRPQCPIEVVRRLNVSAIISVVLVRDSKGSRVLEN